MANEAAMQIRDRVHMEDLFAVYGFSQTRGGFIRCPFHEERTASLKPYADGTRFKCFGCGVQGDVITFVMKLFHLTFPQALVRLDDDFRLGLTAKSHRYENVQKQREALAAVLREQDERRREQEEYWDLFKRFAILDKFLSTNKPDEQQGGIFGVLMAERERTWQKIQEWEEQHAWKR